ncbi:MAG: efflux transporter periplasmic adaptor subunit [Betaproteobacteria bacterium RBG_16_56_24]|nr:MAG: efflux transporter periplasmic adaptor subunit [Betaproteobacteria bacterium RBG_16_56_24]
MKPISIIFIGALALLGVGVTGYWLGGQRTEDRGQKTETTVQKEHARKILYYRNPMGLPDTSPVPKKDTMGMDYVAVYEGGEEPESAASPFDTPGGLGQVKISVEKVQKLGVKTEPATMRVLDKTVRAVGRVEVDEQHIHNIAPKFEGWIEKLHVKTTGEPVKKGQALFDVYSPELVSAQREYAIAVQGVAALKDADGDTRQSMQKLADAALQRLKNWDISEEQVKELALSETTRRSLTFNAFHTPVNGIVLEKKAFEGMRFMPGEMLYQIADLSSVWVIADVFEQDIALVKTGAKTRVKINAYPNKLFEGAITYVYPTLNPATRTIPVRLEIDNPGGLLKPAMFAQVEITVADRGKVLTVPVSAVIDSGTRHIALVQLAEGRFEPRAVSLGKRSDNYVEVIGGVAEGEQVVVTANFLIDAESNLKAALGGLGHAHGGGAADAKGAAQPAAELAGQGAPDAGQGTSEQPKQTAVGYQTEGTLNAFNADGTVSVTHSQIKALGWPGMTMDLVLANSSLVSGVKIGSAISFEIVERKPGEWVITRLQAKAGKPHEGH